MAPCLLFNVVQDKRLIRSYTYLSCEEKHKRVGWGGGVCRIVDEVGMLKISPEIICIYEHDETDVC